MHWVVCSRHACVILGKDIGLGTARWLTWGPLNIPRKTPEMAIKSKNKFIGLTQLIRWCTRDMLTPWAIRKPIQDIYLHLSVFFSLFQVVNMPPPYEGSTCIDTNPKRNASFQNPLKYFKDYSYSSCRQECLIQHNMNDCGCVGFFMASKWMIVGVWASSWRVSEWLWVCGLLHGKWVNDCGCVGFFKWMIVGVWASSWQVSEWLWVCGLLHGKWVNDCGCVGFFMASEWMTVGVWDSSWQISEWLWVCGLLHGKWVNDCGCVGFFMASEWMIVGMWASSWQVSEWLCVCAHFFMASEWMIVGVRASSWLVSEWLWVCGLLQGK